MNMSYGYGCFWDSAFGPWAMFHELDDAIEYATGQSNRSRREGNSGVMRVYLFRDGKWHDKVCWSSVHEPVHETAAEEG